jgi:hypothetical protein
VSHQQRDAASSRVEAGHGPHGRPDETGLTLEHVSWAPRVIVSLFPTLVVAIALSGLAEASTSSLWFTAFALPPSLAWAIYSWCWSCRLRVDINGVKITGQVPWLYRRSWDEIERFELVTRAGYVCLAVRTPQLHQAFKEVGTYPTTRGRAAMEALVLQLEERRDVWTHHQPRRPPTADSEAPIPAHDPARP